MKHPILCLALAALSAAPATLLPAGPAHAQQAAHAQPAPAGGGRPLPRVQPSVFTFSPRPPAPLDIATGNLLMLSSGATVPSAIRQAIGGRFIIQDDGNTSGWIRFGLQGYLTNVRQDMPVFMRATNGILDDNDVAGGQVLAFPSKYTQLGQEWQGGGVAVISAPNTKADRDATSKDAFLEDNAYAFAVAQYPGHDPDKAYPTHFRVKKNGDVMLGEETRRTSYFFKGRIDAADGGADQSEAGNRLFFSGGDLPIGATTFIWDNGDPLYIHRFNHKTNRSVLRVNVGSGGGGTAQQGNADKMELGVYGTDGYAGAWNPSIALYASGDIYAGNEIHARKVVVTTALSFPDYVFAPAYRLAPLPEVEQKIKELGHLPGMPSAAEVAKNGMDLGEQNRLLVEKVEELTLHLIQMRKELDALKVAKK